MEFPIYQIDAFASKAFEGNPAAVCPLDDWLPDAVMQSIAAENNLSETVFFVPSKRDDRADEQSDYYIRWFTPAAEVKLCGHATLASAFVLFNELDFDQPMVVFDSLSGLLSVARDGDELVMDFPAEFLRACDTPELLVDALGVRPSACLKHEDYLVVLESEAQVAALEPDFEKLKQLDLKSVTATALSDRYDFVSRFFAPKVGIDEDPVTGSSFTRLIPYWAGVTGKTHFRAKQISARGGEVGCELDGQRVKIRGRAIKFFAGQMTLNV